MTAVWIILSTAFSTVLVISAVTAWVLIADARLTLPGTNARMVARATAQQQMQVTQAQAELVIAQAHHEKELLEMSTAGLIAQRLQLLEGGGNANAADLANE